MLSPADFSRELQAWIAHQVEERKSRIAHAHYDRLEQVRHDQGHIKGLEVVLFNLPDLLSLFLKNKPLIKTREEDEND